MVITNNMLASNTNRMLGLNRIKRSKSIEKLSSGYRVNRAADDAAGLAISEKMRRQIRGLNQGSNNIQDGISLIQTAEGALHEITDMVHRMKELSVRAYNGTNTTDDRCYIQQEINGLIDEINRTAESTTFNEIQILKGPKMTFKTYTEGQKYHVTDSLVGNSAPDWLMKNSSTSLGRGTLQGTQDVSGIVRESWKDADGKTDKSKDYFFGPKPADPSIPIDGTFKWKEEWSPELSDNLSAKIDFSGLLEMTSAEDLYNAIMGLGGTSFNVPCGTCDDAYMGVGYSIDIEGYSVRPNGSRNSSNQLIHNSGTISLNSVLEKAEELMKTHSEDEIFTDAEKKAQTKILAEEIAKTLRNDSLAKMSRDESHFYRATSEGDYAIGVYDYRDTDLVSLESNPPINFLTECTREYDAEVEVNQTVQRYEPEDIIISCSSQMPDGDFIMIGLPNVSSGVLGLDGYQVTDYAEVTTVRMSEVGQEKINKYNQSLNEYYNDYTLEPKKVTQIYYTPYTYYEKGERKTVDQRMEREITVYEKKYNGTKPTMPDLSGDIEEETKYQYAPSDMNILDAALDKILKMRAQLGATQNRLEHAYNSNRNTEENTTAAESQIRDTDMATETVQFSNHSVLEQAGQSMLAQANQSNQGVLSLLG